MGISIGVGTIIVGLLISAVLAYVLTKINKTTGAWVTVLAPFLALAAVFLLRDSIGTTYSLFFLEFELTEYGWFFSMIMPTTMVL